MAVFKVFKPQYDSSLFVTKSQKIVDEAETLSDDFYSFAAAAWPIVEGKELKKAYFVDAICLHLESCYYSYIKNLILNCPPRMGKSTLVSILFHPWVWTKEPHLKFIFSCYNQELSHRDSRKALRLIRSDWYQQRWGDKVILQKDLQGVGMYENKATGVRYSTSVESGGTGFGSHFSVFDDLNNIQHVKSDADRKNINRYFSEVMTTRIEDAYRNCRIITQQRTHVEDVSGYTIANDRAGSWCVLSLPMKYETGNKCTTYPFGNDEPWEDWRTREEELLHPDLIPQTMIDEWEAGWNYDPYIIAGQMQQRPTPLGGGLLKADYFQKWKEPDLPSFKYILQSWDTATTAKETDGSSFSACTTWGVFTNRDDESLNDVMLLSACQGKWDAPTLFTMALRLYHNIFDTNPDGPELNSSFKPSVVLVENKSSGPGLIQVLQKQNIDVRGFEPRKYGDKTHRVMMASHIIGNKRVWLRTTKSSDYEELTAESELALRYFAMFGPTSPNDLTDTLSQAIIFLEKNNLLLHSTYWRQATLPWQQPNYTELKRSDLMM